MVHSPAVSLLDTSTLLVRKRVRGLLWKYMHASEFTPGWAPATFVSSRADRAKAKVSRPEDYMDEEDLQELRESRTLVDTTEEMDFTGGTAADLKRQQGEDDTEQEYVASVKTASFRSF
jgi:hypothetical protein